MQVIDDIVLGLSAAVMAAGIGLVIAFVFASRASAAAQREMRQKLPLISDQRDE